MYFLIDYENVQNAGMLGTDALTEEDHLDLFYSSSVPTMHSQYLEEIKASGCDFQIHKLKKTQKNGLDFYIATRLGEVFGSGYGGAAVIISRDVGFQAVRDYWTSVAKRPRRVYLSDSIERGIITANLNDERGERVRRRMKPVDIAAFYAAYQENKRIRGILEDALAGTDYLARTGDIQNILGKGKTAKVIYLDVLHRFGRKDGLEIYRRLKGCAQLIG